VTEDRNLQAPVSNAHGLSIEWLRLPVGGKVSRHWLADKQVLIARRGLIDVQVETTAGPVSLSLSGTDTAWDSVSVPAGEWRCLVNQGADEALLVVMTAGDHRKRITWDDAVVRHAREAGWSLDASGFVAPSDFVERAQA
jgi:hypothetical protein